jgi:hypothetical protein
MSEGNNNPTEFRKPPDLSVRIVITYDPMKSDLTVGGHLDRDAVMLLGMLENAKEQILEYHRQKRIQQQIKIAPPGLRV